MRGLWPGFRDNDIVWRCPVLGCSHDNVDEPETALPMCERCGNSFNWSDIPKLFKVTVAQARANVRDAQAIASDWQAVGDDLRKAMGLNKG